MVSSSGLPVVFLTEEQKRLAREPGNYSRSHIQPPLLPLWLSLLGVTVLPITCPEPFALLFKTTTENANLNPTEANEDFPFM